MAGKVFSRETSTLILAMVMAVGLFLALVAGTAAIIWYGKPFGDSARLIADVSAWLFGVAFLTTFVLTLSEETKKGKAHKRTS